MVPRLLFAYCPAKVYAHRVRVEWELLPKEKALEFCQYLDVSSNSGPSFLGKAIKCYTRTRSLWLKIQTKKSNPVKSSEIPTLTPHVKYVVTHDQHILTGVFKMASRKSHIE